MVDTTIKIKKDTRDLLDEFKIHPRQSYDEVLQIIIGHCKDAIKRGDFEIFKRK